LSLSVKKKNDHKKIIEFKDVSLFNHPHSEKSRCSPLLNSFSFSLTNSNIYFLLGNNGSGKSTLVQLAFSIYRPDSGTIILLDKPLEELSRSEIISQVCYVGQHPDHQITLSSFGQYKQKAELDNNSLALTLMNKYILLKDNFPVSMLSPLQKKMICLTSLISSKTKLIILDEPTWGIDRCDQLKIINILNEITDNLDLALLIISHDIKLVSMFQPKVLLIHNGKLIFFDNYGSFSQNEDVKSLFDIP
jgi:ABC-type cobalamin/Fe3+-siderophores transport system ATPase subunit